MTTDKHTTPVLLVAGSGRSGSTVLDVLLGQCDGFFSVGEIRYIWTRGLLENRLCGCGVPFRECRFWTEVFHLAFAGPVPSERIRKMIDIWRNIELRRNLPFFFGSRPNSSFSIDLRQYRATWSALYSAIRAISGARVIVDSSKHPTHGFVLNGTPRIKLLVAQLVRDPRAVAYSWQRRKVNTEIHWKTEYFPTYSPFLAARGWSIANLLTHGLRSVVDQTTFLRYEDLVTSPHEHITSLTKLASQPPPPKDFVECLETKLLANHTVSGNPSRLVSSGLKLRPDTEWREKMPVRQQRLVSFLTAPLLLAYGYPLRPRR